MLRYFTKDSIGTNRQKGPRLVLKGHTYSMVGRKTIVGTDKFNAEWRCSRRDTAGIKCGAYAATTGDENGYWAFETTEHKSNCPADQ